MVLWHKLTITYLKLSTISLGISFICCCNPNNEIITVDECFPFPRKHEDIHKKMKVMLHCSDKCKIKIVEANYIRPGYNNGYGDDTCYQNTSSYNIHHCCDEWKLNSWDKPRKNWSTIATNCVVPMRESILQRCSYNSTCELQISSVQFSTQCGSLCKINNKWRSCRSRRIHIKYYCYDNETPVNSVAFGVAIPCSLILGAILMFGAMKFILKRSKQKQSDKDVQIGTGLGGHSFTNATMSSTNAYCLNENPYYEGEVEMVENNKSKKDVQSEEATPQSPQKMIDNTYYESDLSDMESNEQSVTKGNIDSHYVYTYGHFRLEGRSREPKQ